MKTIVIDPGHGGKDSGALGPGGTKESDIVLSVGLKLRELLVDHYKVHMTRADDTFVSLSARADMANKLDADFFLSLHCNSAKNPALGFEAFTSHGHTASDNAAKMLLKQYHDRFPSKRNRGAKEASFTVLTSTNMSAVLYELEFIHIRDGEGFLKNEINQQGMAQALAEGIMDFLPTKEEPPIGGEEDLTFRYLSNTELFNIVEIAFEELERRLGE